MSMYQQKTVSVNWDAPLEMHQYLESVCAEDGISLSSFITDVFKEKFERENRIDSEIYEQRMRDLAEHGAIPFDQAMKEIGL